MRQTVTFTELTINQVSEAARTIKLALTEYGDIVVNLKGIPVVDTAAVQLLIAAKKEAEALHCSITFKNVDIVESYMLRIGASL